MTTGYRLHIVKAKADPDQSEFDEVIYEQKSKNRILKSRFL